MSEVPELIVFANCRKPFGLTITPLHLFSRTIVLLLIVTSSVSKTIQNDVIATW